MFKTLKSDGGVAKSDRGVWAAEPPSNTHGRQLTKRKLKTRDRVMPNKILVAGDTYGEGPITCMHVLEMHMVIH